MPRGTKAKKTAKPVARGAKPAPKSKTANGARGAAAKKPSRISVPGEKRVKPTAASVPVEPVKVTAEARKPTPLRAIDRRTNVEPGGPAGNNSGGSVR